MDSQIRGLETRLKYAKTDMESTSKQIKAVEKELAELSREMQQYGVCLIVIVLVNYSNNNFCSHK